jgi:TerC family integral membrane protein
MPSPPNHPWATFAIVVLAALAADLLIFHRKEHAVGLKEAAIESAGWIGLALLFNAWVYHARGPAEGLEFLTAYVVEKTLSIDNIFVFILIFSALGVPARSQHKVLFYGVAGALALRGIFIWAGVELLRRFGAILYVFAAILLVTGIRMLLSRKRTLQPERNWLVRLARFALPIADHSEGDTFMSRDGGGWKFTSLFIALIAVEAMDIIFAVDSVPAVLAITRQPFIAYSSNAFAILGLRALYFALSAALVRLRYLHTGLAIILVFVAVKMIAGERLHFSTGVSLVVVGAILAVTGIASLAAQGKAKTEHEG